MPLILGGGVDPTNMDDGSWDNFEVWINLFFNFQIHLEVSVYLILKILRLYFCSTNDNMMTPPKICMEPENYPFEKETHLPNLHFAGVHANFRGCKHIRTSDMIHKICKGMKGCNKQINNNQQVNWIRTRNHQTHLQERKLWPNETGTQTTHPTLRSFEEVTKLKHYETFMQGCDSPTHNHNVWQTKSSSLHGWHLLLGNFLDVLGPLPPWQIGSKINQSLSKPYVD